MTDIFGPIDYDRINVVSAVLDSTTTTLSASDVYTGSSFSVSNYKQVVGTLYSDVDGTLEVQFRNDGTNWDGESTINYVGGDLTGFVIDVVGNTCRLKYTNGSSAQTTFRLYVRGRKI